ncbi:MAG: hypothetical protein M1820_009466 [Bogoriella megaspora]|nr:MAG: hypothetical protein M1820_009466 [Bogoriella megaspora]
MLDPYTSLGIAIIVFYIPAVAVTAALVWQHGRPRMAWISLLLFACARLASGCVLVPYTLNPSDRGLLAGVSVTINVGVVPLLLSTIGLIRIIHQTRFPTSEKLRKSIGLTRAAVLVGVGLLTAGSVLESTGGGSEQRSHGVSLGKAGYFILAAVLGVILVFEVFLVRNWRSFPTMVKRCTTTIGISLPFQVLRITYALLGFFHPERWSALTGPIGRGIGMGLVMEYIVVIIYVVNGLVIEPVNSKGTSWNGELL